MATNEELPASIQRSLAIWIRMAAWPMSIQEYRSKRRGDAYERVSSNIDIAEELRVRVRGGDKSLTDSEQELLAAYLEMLAFSRDQELREKGYHS